MKMKRLGMPSFCFRFQISRHCGIMTAAVLAFILTLVMPPAASAQEPAAPQVQPQAQTPPEQAKPKSHAELHAEAHALAVAQAQKPKDASLTPKERYVREVEGRIGRLWHMYVSIRKDVPPGRVEMSFYLTPKGKAEGIVINDDKQSNVLLMEVSLRALRDAEYPPMPPELVADLPEKPGESAGRLRMDYVFAIDPPAAKKRPKLIATDPPKAAAAPTPKAP